MKLLIFLAFRKYGLACKYGIIFQISLHNWNAELHFLIPGVTINNRARP